MDGGEQVARLNAEVEDELRKRLFHVLIDEGISFSEWLRQQIDTYLSEKDPKRAGVRELGDRRKVKRWTDIPNDTGKKKMGPRGKQRKGKKAR